MPGEQAAGGAPTALVLTIGTPSYSSYASAIVDARSRLRRMFEIDVVSGPSFDMLLLIYAANERDEPIGAGEIEASMQISPETMARWRHLLEQNDILVGGETLVLTPSARGIVGRWLTDVSSIPLSRE